jgi:hypothetical protein
MPWLWRYKQDSRVPSKLKSRSWLWRYKTQEFHKNYNLDYGCGDTRLEFHKNYNLDNGFGDTRLKNFINIQIYAMALEIQDSRVP